MTSAFQPASLATSRPDSRLAIQRAVLPQGLVVVGSENHTHQSVVIRLILRAAPLLDTPETAGLASLTASGLTRGTQSRSFSEINQQIDEAGMSLSSGTGRHTCSISSRCLADDLPLAIELMADVARNPAFPEHEINQLRGQVLTGLRQADDDTGSVSDRRFRELLYPVGHPYRLRSHGYQETVAGLTRDHLAGFHQQHYGISGAVCTVVGDVDFADVCRRLEAALGDWNGALVPAVDTSAPPPAPPAIEDAVLDGKTQSDLVLGIVGITRSDPDYYAWRMANMILGRLGMMGRLGESVREAQGLAYGVHSELDAGLGAGPWAVRAGVNPSNVDKALKGIGDELVRIRDGGVTADELLRGQRYSSGSLVLQLETNDGVAGIIQDVELYGLGLDYIDRYPDIINGLTLDIVNEVASRRFPALEQTVRVVAGPQRS